MRAPRAGIFLFGARRFFVCIISIYVSARCYFGQQSGVNEPRRALLLDNLFFSHSSLAWSGTAHYLDSELLLQIAFGEKKESMHIENKSICERIATLSAARRVRSQWIFYKALYYHFS